MWTSGTSYLTIFHSCNSWRPSIANTPLPALPGSLRPRLRDITSLSSWMYCFLVYVAIRSQDPATQHMLAYGQLIIREALRHSGKGWLDYDRVFRKQAALDSSMRWNTLNTGIQASTLVDQTGGVSTFCTLRREVDHNTSQCALTYLQQTGDHAGPARLVFLEDTCTEATTRVPKAYNVCHGTGGPVYLHLQAHLCDLSRKTYGMGLC